MLNVWKTPPVCAVNTALTNFLELINGKRAIFIFYMHNLPQKLNFANFTMKSVIPILLIAVLFASCTSQFGRVLKSKDNEYKLKMAEQYYVQKKYDKAQQIFDDIFAYFKGDPRFENMYFKYAYCAYYSQDYLSSENLFKTFTESFPNSTKEDEAEYMRAYCFYKQSPKIDLDQTNTQKTISLLQAYINTHSESPRVKEATNIIDLCRKKLEQKEANNAQLYWALGNCQASAVAFGTVMEDFPDSDKGEEYKLNIIRGYFKYAQLSIFTRQQERFQKVVNECDDFSDRYPESKLKSQVADYRTQSTNNIKKLKDEQAKATTQL